MKKSDIQPMPPFYDRYINLVDDIDVLEALKINDSIEKLVDVDSLYILSDQRYAPEKWTVKDILQHVIDNERIQSYRALRFARNDKTSLPGFDENLYAAHTNAQRRSVDDLLEEFKQVRQSSIFLFKSFTDEMLLRDGVCFSINMTVLALGFVLAGHQVHHINIIKERYFPLLNR